MPDTGGRDYEVVLLGATGFTGGLTARYLAARAPDDLRWAIAGRDRGRLADLADQLQRSTPRPRRIGVVPAEVKDPGSMRALAESTRLVATTVGPYQRYGAAVVAACARSGTDYVDISGESEFVDRMWLEHQAKALASGSRLVHCCGFDSIPHDVGVWWTLRYVPRDVPLRVAGYVRASGGLSAGTYASAVHAFGRARQAAALAGQRRRAETTPADRSVGSLLARPHQEPGSGRWAVPLPTIDPVVVRRSALALPVYGPDFRYGHYAVVGGLGAVAATTVGVAGIMALAQLPPTRAALLRLGPAGQRPSPSKRARSWFRVRFVAVPEGAATPVVTEVAGGDPGYEATAAMLAESALCLARDPVPELAGQLTPVQAMGDALVPRLQRAGMTFRRLEMSE